MALPSRGNAGTGCIPGSAHLFGGWFLRPARYRTFCRQLLGGWGKVQAQVAVRHDLRPASAQPASCEAMLRHRFNNPSISADLEHAEGLSAAMPSALTPMRPARVARPCIVATAVDPRHSTHGRQTELARLLAHESVPRRHPFWDESDSAPKQPSLTSQVSAGCSLSVASNASGSPPAFISLRGEPHEQYSCNCLG